MAKASNLFPIVATLMFLKVPFEFRPNKRYNNNKWKNGFGASVIEFDLLAEGEGRETGELSIADILFHLNEKYNNTFHFTILQELKY